MGLRVFLAFLLSLCSVRGFAASNHRQPQFSLMLGSANEEEYHMKRGSITRDDKGKNISIYQFEQEIRLNDFFNIGYLGRVNKGDMFLSKDSDSYLYGGISMGLFTKLQYVMSDLALFTKVSGFTGVLIYKLPGVLFSTDIQFGFSYYFSQWFGFYVSYGAQVGWLKETIFSAMREENAEIIFKKLGLTEKGSVDMTTNAKVLQIGLCSTYW